MAFPRQQCHHCRHHRRCHDAMVQMQSFHGHASMLCIPDQGVEHTWNNIYLELTTVVLVEHLLICSFLVSVPQPNPPVLGKLLLLQCGLAHNSISLPMLMLHASI